MEPFLVRLRPAVTDLANDGPAPIPVAPDGASFRLAANEASYPPLPSVQAAIAAAAGQLNRYPDHRSAELTALLAARLDVRAEQIVVGAGSTGLLQALLGAVCSPGDAVVYGWRSFEAFPALIRVAGAVGVPVGLRDHRMDLPAIAAAVSERTRVVMICNPNNPTGTMVDAKELSDFVAALPPECLVVLDEAYREYAAAGLSADGVDLHRRHPNVAVVRTFSKAHGLAGLRVGFLVAHARVADAVVKAQPPFAVSRLAQVAAATSVRCADELADRIWSLVTERERVRRGLRERGLTTPDSQGNFLWLPLGPASAALARACEADGLAVRHFAGEGVRVTIGTVAANDRFLRIAGAFAVPPVRPARARVPAAPPPASSSTAGRRRTGGTVFHRG